MRNWNKINSYDIWLKNLKLQIKNSAGMIPEKQEETYTDNNKIAVIIDDHRLFAESFSELLKKARVFEDVVIMSGYKEFIYFLLKNSKKQKIYLFLDYYLKDALGIEFIDQARKLHRKMCVIIVSTVTKLSTIQTILAHRPEGIISKSSGFDIILECIHSIENGNEYYCPYMRDALNQLNKNEPVVFSNREIELLKLCAKGVTIEEAARILTLSRHTIVSHRRRMMNRTNTKSITELLGYVRENGIIAE